jgi:hypothetical protein
MINKFMKDTSNKPVQKPTLEKKTNEKSGYVVSSHIKIFDPNTKEVLVHKRAS